MLISLFPTPFGRFQILGSAGQNPKLILTLCHIGVEISRYVQDCSLEIGSLSNNEILTALIRAEAWQQRNLRTQKYCSSTVQTRVYLEEKW